GGGPAREAVGRLARALVLPLPGARRSAAAVGRRRHARRRDGAADAAGARLAHEDRGGVRAEARDPRLSGGTGDAAHRGTGTAGGEGDGGPTVVASRRVGGRR